MGEEETADGGQQQRSGEHEAVVRDAKPGVSDDVIEDANSQREHEAVGEGVVAGDDSQIGTSLISEFGADNPGMGSSSQQGSEADMEEGYGHLLTDAMKLQLRAQILVLGDLLKGVAPNPDWLEDACLESAIGAESVLLESIDVPRGAQDVRCENTGIDYVPAESNLPKISSGFRDSEARMSPFSGAADLPTTRDAIKDGLHSARRLSTPGEPSSSGKGLSFRDDSLAQATDIAPLGQLLITYDQTPTARSNSNVAEDYQATENRNLDNDRHLDLAQASAQDALTTATSALAQSHMVWARLHSQDHSEEGIARDSRLASVAATVAAASSVAKAAVEAARAIAEVSMDAFIQAGGYQPDNTGVRTLQFGSARSRPLQVDSLERFPHNNARENAAPSQQRADMLESVVQAAGKAAEAATQAGAVLAKANPMIQTGCLSGFWSRKPDEADVEHEGNKFNELNEGNEMDAADEVDALEEMEDIQEEDNTYQDKLDAMNEMNNVHAQDILNHEEAVEADMAAANANEVAEANGDAVVGVNEAAGVAAVIEVEVAAANEDGAVGANEVAEAFEQEKRIGPRSRKSKRGRGSSRGVSSRGKRTKISIRVSSPPLPAQSPENATQKNVDVCETLQDVDVSETLQDVDVSETLQDVRDEILRGKKRAKQIENTPVRIFGEDITASAPAQSPENEIHKRDDVSTSRKNSRGKRGKKRGAKHIEIAVVHEIISDTAPAQIPENDMPKQDDLAKSRMNSRGKTRSARHTSPATAPVQSPENGVHKQDDVLKSRKSVGGKKRGAKHVNIIPLGTSGEDIPSTAELQSPENELHKKGGVSRRKKNVKHENARGRTRGAKHVENTNVSLSGKDTADRDLREPETDANTHEGRENIVQEGRTVEVMIDEVGLRGGWFSGTVLRMVPNEVFVELQDLLTDDGKAKVREWFPLVEGSNPHHRRRHARPVHPFTIFSEAGSRKRRRVALGSQTWHIGDQVDAFIQDAWWEGIVAEINDLDPTKATVYFPEENDTQVVKTWDLRPSFHWKENKWLPWKTPALVEDERAQKRHRTGDQNKKSGKAGLDELTSNDKPSEEGRPEGSRIQQEIVPETHEPPLKDQQESTTPLQRPNWKKSNKKNVKQEQIRHSPRNRRKAHQTGVVSPGTAKKLDLPPSAAATASAPGIDAAQVKTPMTKGKPRRRRKRYT